VRGTLAILQSADSADLYRLFTRYAEQIEERSSFKIECSGRGEPKPLSAPRMRQLFYIYREILNNVEKHAQAGRVKMEMMWEPEQLALILTDNGRGFDVNQIPYGDHYGLKFMKERAELLNGSLHIESELGTGTKVTVEVPYETA
jgi:signal transduction histidine kinase